MRVLVCGGRFYSDRINLYGVLDAIKPSLIIHGDASGADELAGSYARARGIPLMVFPALWDAQGKAAGPIRNERMLALGKPDLVVAFPGGVGTAHMIRIAREAGVPVQEMIS